MKGQALWDSRRNNIRTQHEEIGIEFEWSARENESFLISGKLVLYREGKKKGD